jgi:FixJ family two-component response regulator
MAETSIVIRIVEPDARARVGLRTLLENLDVPVEEYASAGELLAAADETSRGCVVTEVQLPDGCGLSLHERLRELAPQLPVIMLARNPDVGLAVRAMRAGAVDFFEMPVDEREFLRRVRAALARTSDPGPSATN